MLRHGRHAKQLDQAVDGAGACLCGDGDERFVIVVGVVVFVVLCIYTRINTQTYKLIKGFARVAPRRPRGCTGDDPERPHLLQSAGSVRAPPFVMCFFSFSHTPN